MRPTTLRQISQAAIIVVAGAFIVVPPAAAQNSSGPTVAQFLANPSEVLQQFPNGGPQLISLIRDACLENPSALSSIIALLGNAKTDQQTALGSGLGQCALSSARTNPAYADQIQNAIALSGIQNAILAYAGVTGNVPIASTGIGTGGVGGGAGGPTGPGGPSGGTNTGSPH